MAERPGRIVALGGGGFSMEPKNPLMDDYVLALTGAERPRICFLPTASGDADHYVVRFYRRFGGARAEPSHVSLFRRDTTAGAVEGDIEQHLLQQDVIYVGGGSLKSLLGAWRAHGLDRTLERAWRQGVLLCGLSAGSLCWFSDAVTAFHGPSERVKGLGFLPFSNCVHYDGEPERREAFRALVGGGVPAGYGVDDGAALVFRGTELDEVVTSRPQATAYRVRRTASGTVDEQRLEARYLGAPAPPPGLSASPLAPSDSPPGPPAAASATPPTSSATPPGPPASPRPSGDVVPAVTGAAEDAPPTDAAVAGDLR